MQLRSADSGMVNVAGIMADLFPPESSLAQIPAPLGVRELGSFLPMQEISHDSSFLFAVSQQRHPKAEALRNRGWDLQDYDF